MATKTHNLSPQLYKYLQEVSLREPDILKELKRETAKLPSSVMQISPEQGQFMRLLIQLIGATKILEVGVFTGYSALSMALALPYEGEIIACDKSEKWTSIARRYWQNAGVNHKIQLILGSATDTLRGLIEEKQGYFDMAFIDADKLNYDSYYEYSLQLTRPGGLILIDNTLWEGKVINPEIKDPDTNAIKKLNLKLLNDTRIDLSMLPIGDGLTLVRKR